MSLITGLLLDVGASTSKKNKNFMLINKSKRALLCHRAKIFILTAVATMSLQ
jgi:hypothetical protein